MVSGGRRGRFWRRSVEGNGEILYVRDGISVWNGGMVKRTIIPTWAPVSYLGYHV